MSGEEKDSSDKLKSFYNIKLQTDDEKDMDLDTLLIHADDDVQNLPDLAPPIHLATTFIQDNPDGYIYSRFQSPTRSRLEAVLGALEGGTAVVYSSGLASVMATLMLFKPSKIWIDKGYLGTHHVIEQYLSQAGGEWYNRIGYLAENIAPIKGDLLWVESPKNPTCELSDISHYVKIAHEVGAYVVVDSTFATPVLQRPLELGVDVVMHSGTKFLAGHSDVLAGVLIAKNPSVGFKLTSQRTNSGAILGNLENYLFLRSLRTLKLRVKRQVKTTIAIAAFLETQPIVTKVWHPSLKSSPQHELCAKQLKYPPPILSFEVTTMKGAGEITTKLKLIAKATSLGGVHSTIDWRYQFDDKQPPTLLRLSIGLESKKDLIKDLTQALNSIE